MSDNNFFKAIVETYKSLSIVYPYLFLIIIVMYTFIFYTKHQIAFFIGIVESYILVLIFGMFISLVAILYLIKNIKKNWGIEIISILMIYSFVITLFIVSDINLFWDLSKPENLWMNYLFSIFFIILLIGLAIIFSQIKEIDLKHIVIPVIMLILCIGVILIQNLNEESPVISKEISCEKKHKEINSKPNPHSINNSVNSLSSNYTFKCHLNENSKNFTILEYNFTNLNGIKIINNDTKINIYDNNSFYINTPSKIGEFELNISINKSTILTTKTNIVSFEDFVDAKESTQEKKLRILIGSLIIVFILSEIMLKTKIISINRIDENTKLDTQLKVIQYNFNKLRKENKNLTETLEEVEKVKKEMCDKLNRIIKEGKNNK